MESNEQNQELELLKKVEAALFLAARWLDIDELVRLTSINPIMLQELLSKLEERYKSNDGAIMLLKAVVEGTESWKMDIHQEYAYMINRLATGESEFTKAEQETLAIIAYKQPIKQSVIVKIRGNKSYDHIKHFIQSGLIRAKKAGRTLELNLGENFYNYFNLKK
jgi:segregation and condensation protein B